MATDTRRALDIDCNFFCFQDRRAEVMLLVGPKCGISQVTDIKSFTVSVL